LAPLAVEACDAISRALFRDPLAREHPELIVLANWLRRANVQALGAELAASAPDGIVRVPRGLAFHVPPANVDTMAIYSLALSLLAGNRNVVRLSSRSGPAIDRICAALETALADERLAPVRAGTAILTWGHEAEPTELCSAACDVRMIWGGDAAVAAVRRAPLSPRARDVAFVDRFSMAALRSDAYLAASEADRDELAHRLFNDAYWFDQRGCSSPRLLLWCGSPEAADAAGEDLYGRLAAQVGEREYALPLGAVTGKLAWVAGAVIDRPVTRVRTWGNELTVLRLDTLEGLSREHPGAGVFLEATLESLTELAPHVTSRDQTLGVFGFPGEELAAFVAAAGARGVDRIVPLGEALSFDRNWDGLDLFAELTRQVVVAPGVACVA
jgi:hypothetical protein